MESEVWPAAFRRAWVVAAYARRFRLLAQRYELLDNPYERRSLHALNSEAPDPLHLFDAAQVIGATELDRLCAYAVRQLSKGQGDPTMLLDVLGILDNDRAAAIYYALPPEAREIADRDPTFGYFAAQVRHEMPDAEAALLDLIDGTPTSEVGYALARIDVDLGELVRTYPAP